MNERNTKGGVSRPPLERMMRIHQEISSGTFPNTRSLSEDIEVSRKSISRDIDFMRDRLNLPIDYDKKKYGYYYTSEVTSFPALQISEGELFALLVAEKAMQQYKGTPFEKPLLKTLQKLASGLPETVSMNLDHWNESISFKTSAEPIINLHVIDTLSKATAQRNSVFFEYKKPGASALEKRKVDPYHLANIDGEWFLFGYCHLRMDVRTFSPTRMKHLHILDQKFPKPDFDVKKRLSSSFGVITGDKEFVVVCRFSDKVADFIREKKWHSSQKLKSLPGGGVEISLIVSNLIEVRSWILSWGGEAEVIKPPELRESIHTSASKIVDRG